MKQRLLVLGLAAYTAMCGAAWWIEHQARTAVEAELARRPRAEPAGKAPSQGDGTAKETPDRVARDPSAAEGSASGTPAAPASGGATGSGKPPDPVVGGADGRSPTGGSGADGHATAAGPTAGASGKEEIEVDPARPLEEFERVLPLLRDRMGLPIGDRGARDRALVLRTLGELLAAAPQEIASRLVDALRAEPHYGLFRQLVDLLHGVNPERAGLLVREMAESSDARRRENALSSLDLLPEGDAEIVWRRMVADPDPDVRQTAIGFPPGHDARFDSAVREAVMRESDPKLRGQGMHTLFSARPTQENLEFLLREIRQSGDSGFRSAALEWFGWELTVRDTGAITALRELATQGGGDLAVRRRAAEILLRGGFRKEGLVPRAERSRWEAVLAEAEGK